MTTDERAELVRAYRERDQAREERNEAMAVIRELRQKLSIAGVEGSPPPGGQGLIPELEQRLRAAIAEAGAMLAVLKAAVSACISDHQQTFDDRQVVGWCSDCGGENREHQPGCWVGDAAKLVNAPGSAGREAAERMREMEDALLKLKNGYGVQHWEAGPHNQTDCPMCIVEAALRPTTEPKDG